MAAKWLTLILVLLSICASPIWAQAVYGTIIGIVVDSSGAAIANAVVTITDIRRDVTQTTSTNESGNYTQRFFIAGTYKVRIEAPGFRTSIQDDVPVSVDTEVRLSTSLELGQMNQTVEVTTEAGIRSTPSDGKGQVASPLETGMSAQQFA